MDFNELNDEVLELIEYPDKRIPEEYEWFFEEVGGISEAKRQRLSEVYRMWLYAQDNLVTVRELALKFDLPVSTIYYHFSWFNVELPTIRYKYDSNSKETNFYQWVLSKVIEGATEQGLGALWSSRPQLNKHYTWKDFIHVVTILNSFSEAKLYTLEKELTKL